MGVGDSIHAYRRRVGMAQEQGFETTEAAHGRLSRRRFLQLTSAAAGAAALGVWPGASAAGAPAVIKPTAELVVAFSLDPGHFDPRVEAGVPGFSMMYPHMYETVVWRRKDLMLDPAISLAEKWEQVNPTTLRLQLRQGVKFHNGDPFDAEAVKVSAEAYTAPESKFPVKSSMAVTREVRVTDTSTVDYITEVPSRPLLRILGLQAMMSPRALQELGPKIATHPIGTGPYTFVEYIPGQHVLMEANPNYWGPKPKSNRLKIRFIPENGTRLAALESGEVMMITNVPPDSIKRLESNPQLEMRTSVTNRIMFITLRTDRPPWTDKRARQALNYAVDKQIGEAIAGYLSDVGLQVNFDNPTWSSFVTEISKFDKAKYDGYFFGWGVVTGEPDQLMREHFHSKFTRRNAYKNPEVDRLVDEAAESFNDAKVKAAYAKAQEIVWDECPWIFLHLQPDLNAVNKRLHGFMARPDEWLILTEAYLA